MLFCGFSIVVINTSNFPWGPCIASTIRSTRNKNSCSYIPRARLTPRARIAIMRSTVSFGLWVLLSTFAKLSFGQETVTVVHRGQNHVMRRATTSSAAAAGSSASVCKRDLGDDEYLVLRDSLELHMWEKRVERNIPGELTFKQP